MIKDGGANRVQLTIDSFNLQANSTELIQIDLLSLLITHLSLFHANMCLVEDLAKQDFTRLTNACTI